MVYLYAGLGVLMLSGIMAIFEMGLSLTGLSMMPTPADIYLQDSDLKMSDKRLMELLRNSNAVSQGLANQALCTALVQDIQKISRSIDLQADNASNDQGRWFGLSAKSWVSSNSDHALNLGMIIFRTNFSFVLVAGYDQCSSNATRL